MRNFNREKFAESTFSQRIILNFLPSLIAPMMVKQNCRILESRNGKKKLPNIQGVEKEFS
jgi:hypothetical protein